MAVIAVLFTEKAVGLAREATAANQAEAHAAPPVASVVTPVRPAGVIVSGKPEARDASPAELRLLQELRQRRKELDEREHQLDLRAEVLQSTAVKLQQRIEQLTSLQQSLEKLDQQRHAHDGGNWSGLVQIYEDMKPKEAADIFNILDMAVLLEVFDRMDSRKASAVLMAMMPERAKLVTQMIAQRRLHADGPSSSDALQVPKPG